MEEIMIGREMNPKEMIPEEENQEGAKIFGKLAGASLLYALVYTGCLFENVMGLASVLWVASSVWYVRSGCSGKRRDGTMALCWG